MRMILKNTQTLVLVGALFVLGSCNEDKKTKGDSGEVELKVEQKSTIIDEKLLIGSWLDSSESALHFSMFEDGTARSDNMKTLLYEKWRLEGDTLILTARSIGNREVSVSDEVFEIRELSDKNMTLKKGEYLLEFERKN